MADKRSSGVDRRTVLMGGAAGFAAAAGIGGCKGAKNVTVDTGMEGRIDHVVHVMMENRSFDHYMGGLSLEGRTDVDGLTGDESNPSRDGDPVKVFPLHEQCQDDPPHGWGSSHAQFADGENSGFVEQHTNRVGAVEGEKVMGYYRRQDLPVHYTLADHFAVPNRWFASVMGPTWPNRLYAHAGTSGGQGDNTFPPAGGFTFPSVYTKLAEAGHDWRYYYTDVPFLGLFKDLWDDEKIGEIASFYAAARTGNLPAFTWVDPGFSFNDDHPPHHIGNGQLFLASIYEALAQSPAWERTLLVITYDEHGGFFDHVPPPTVDDDHARQGFDQLGFRVPCIVVGPWVKPGGHDMVFDHTSVLKYLCERFGMTPWTARIAQANSIGSLLDTDRMATGEALAAPVLPAFDVPEGETDGCQYAGVPGGMLVGQPELGAWLKRHQPGKLEAMDVEASAEAVRSAARDLGLDV